MIMSWLRSHSRCEELESAEAVCLPLSLRALCLSLAAAVCHTTARRGGTLSSLSCIPPSCHSLTHSPLQTENMSPSAAQMMLKGLRLPLREPFSSSANRCAQPVPSDIHLSIRHPVLEAFCMTLSLLPTPTEDS